MSAPSNPDQTVDTLVSRLDAAIAHPSQLSVAEVAGLLSEARAALVPERWVVRCANGEPSYFNDGDDARGWAASVDDNPENECGPHTVERES